MADRCATMCWIMPYRFEAAPSRSSLGLVTLISWTWSRNLLPFWLQHGCTEIRDPSRLAKSMRTHRPDLAWDWSRCSQGSDICCPYSCYSMGALQSGPEDAPSRSSLGLVTVVVTEIPPFSSLRKVTPGGSLAAASL